MPLVVRSRNPSRFIGNLARLNTVLAGRDPRFSGIRNLFWSTYMREMFRRIHHSFRVRSRGEYDDGGNLWSPLQKKTVERKRRIHRHSGRSKRRVGPAPHPHFINRDTEKLFKSLGMGLISGNTYQPRSNQIARYDGQGITLGTKVSYAEDVNELREIIPIRSLRKWTAESIAEAYRKILPRLSELDV